MSATVLRPGDTFTPTRTNSIGVVSHVGEKTLSYSYTHDPERRHTVTWGEFAKIVGKHESNCPCYSCRYIREGVL